MLYKSDSVIPNYSKRTLSNGIYHWYVNKESQFYEDIQNRYGYTYELPPLINREEYKEYYIFAPDIFYQKKPFAHLLEMKITLDDENADE